MPRPMVSAAAGWASPLPLLAVMCRKHRSSPCPGSGFPCPERHLCTVCASSPGTCQTNLALLPWKGLSELPHGCPPTLGRSGSSCKCCLAMGQFSTWLRHIPPECGEGGLGSQFSELSIGHCHCAVKKVSGAALVHV